MLYLNADDVRQALPMSQAVDAMKRAFTELVSGKAKAPHRTVLSVAEDKGDYMMMPGMMNDGTLVGTKLLTLLPDNPDAGRPLIHALMTLFDGCTGEPLAIMDGGILTALRTGAASGAATDLLAREDSRVVTILGAGRQGRTQLEAVCSVRTITRVHIFDLIPEASNQFASEMTERLGIPVSVSPSADIAVQKADIVCTATSSGHPQFADDSVRPGTHINAIGCYRTDRHEIPPATVERSKVVVDQLEAAKAEASDIAIPVEKGLITWEDVYAELGEISAGDKTGRATDDEITLFKSVGSVVQDIAAASCALQNAQKLGLGKKLE